MASTLLPASNAFYRVLGADSLIVPGALLETYEAGTSTPLATYSDEALATPNTNPVVADAGGLFGPIFALPQAYKLVLKTAAGVIIATRDNVFPAQAASSANVDITGVAGVDLSAGEPAYLSDGSGGLSAGQWYPTDADEPYSSTLPYVGFAVSAILAGAQGLIRTNGKLNKSGLTPGADYFVSATTGDITTTAPENKRYLGRAESTTILAIATVPPPSAVAANKQTTTATGSQHNFDLNARHTTLYCTGAAPEFSGFQVLSAAPYDGDTVTLVCLGTTVKTLTQSGSSDAENRVICPSTQGQIVGVNGTISLVYDGTTDRWRMQDVEPGAAISYTPTWTAAVTDPVIGDGTLEGRFIQRGILVWLQINLTASSTTTFGSGAYAWALPFVEAQIVESALAGLVRDLGTANYVSLGEIADTGKIRVFASTATSVVVSNTAPMTWASGDQLLLSGDYRIS